MLLGIVLLKKKYSVQQYISIVMITIGITMATMASSNDQLKTSPGAETTETAGQSFIDLLWWLAGISMLTLALFLSAGMGLIQEDLYKNHGKYPSEALYYNVCTTTN